MDKDDDQPEDPRSVSFFADFAKTDGQTFHMVRGVRRRGLIVDPGAASGLMGTDTLLDIKKAVLDPQGLSMVVSDSDSTFSGIDGVSNGAAGCVRLLSPLPELKKVTFDADLIGGAGSGCPGLMPLSTMITYLMTLFCGLLTRQRRHPHDLLARLCRALCWRCFHSAIVHRLQALFVTN